MAAQKLISIVIPCYNEEEILPQLFFRITKVFSKLPYQWEVICVDDGSKDRTFELLEKQHAKNPHWKCISLSRNFGHQTAISCGIHNTSGDAVIVMDADLQDPPEELHRYIDKWLEGYEVVYAIRKKRKENFVKRFCYWSFYRILQHVTEINVPLDSGDFSLMDKKVVDVLKIMPERNRFVRGLRAWVGFKQIGLEYDRAARAAGETKYSVKKLFKLATDGILSFSSLPLTAAARLGMFVSILALIGILFTLIQRVFSSTFSKIGLGPVPGYATIVIALLFLGGIQLMFLGIIGAYLSRIYDEVKNRPLWVIKSSAGIVCKS
jgi:dolichol-phosphate mannosyltransferase